MTAIDSMGLKLFDENMRDWLWLNRGKVKWYLDCEVAKGIRSRQHDALIEEFYQIPLLGYNVVTDWYRDNELKLEHVYRKIADTPGASSIILGQVGKGKTAFGLHLLEEIHNRYGLPVAMLQTDLVLPPWIEQYLDVFSVPEDTVLFIDEASMTFNARRAMSKENLEISQLLNIRRHQNLRLIFASQHHGFMEINAMRGAHFFFFKELSWEEQTKKHGSSAFDYLLRFIKMMMPTHPSETLFTDGIDWMKLNTPLPSFWTDKVSRSYRKWTIDDVITYIQEATEEGVRMPQMEQQLAIRGYRKLTRAEIRRIQEEPEAFRADFVNLYGEPEK